MKRGARPYHPMAHQCGLPAHQPAAAWHYISRHVRFCQKPLPMLWQVILLVLGGGGGVSGELSTLRQMLKVPNEPGLSPNKGLGKRGPKRSVHGKQNVLAPRRPALMARPVKS